VSTLCTSNNKGEREKEKEIYSRCWLSWKVTYELWLHQKRSRRNTQKNGPLFRWESYYWHTHLLVLVFVLLGKDPLLQICRWRHIPRMYCTYTKFIHSQSECLFLKWGIKKKKKKGTLRRVDIWSTLPPPVCVEMPRGAHLSFPSIHMWWGELPRGRAGSPPFLTVAFPVRSARAYRVSRQSATDHEAIRTQLLLLTSTTAQQTKEYFKSACVLP